MASTFSMHLQSLALLLLLLAQLAHPAIVPKLEKPITRSPRSSSSTNTYIVHADHLAKPSHFATLGHWYASMVATHAGDNGSRILYTYDTVMHGFAVQLTADEARCMSSAPGVAAVNEDVVYYPQTTRSPGFIGLDPGHGAWSDTDFGDGVIIGFIDTGISPESPSFNEFGLGPVRPSWKGSCVGFNSTGECNHKLVGAKSFTAAADALLGRASGGATPSSSPRDVMGHGTHVASTAAGSAVDVAGLFMFSWGTARGVAPKARIAMYKACSPYVCPETDIIAAADAAVKDGVDILSVSLGADARPLYQDSLAVAMFGAQRAGVFVALAAGNAGPRPSTVTNVAPWMTTVGATTVDRTFPASLTLGNGLTLTGQSLYTMAANRTAVVRLVLLRSCSTSEFVPDVVMGKVVVCMRRLEAWHGVRVQNAGGAGLVGVDGAEWHADGSPAALFTLPALTLGLAKGQLLEEYINSVPYPVASFTFGCETVTGKSRAPTVVGFSSRGPNAVVPELLKPDVVAPGLNILAAWPLDVPLSDDGARKADYNMLSGTSMACPHVAGVAALIKKKHGDWTPAMIRSAMMTTAATRDNKDMDISDNGAFPGHNFTAATPLAAGAGFVRPELAVDPGLVYDAGTRDYIDFLCSLNYTAEQLRVFMPGMANCTSATPLPGGPAGLNYPSFVVAFDGNRTGAASVRTLTRTLTKVYEKPETYEVTVAAPDGVKVSVTPTRLEFKEQNEKRSYTVEFTSEARGNVKPTGMGFGEITWENRKHKVRSPVVFMWKN